MIDFILLHMALGIKNPLGNPLGFNYQYGQEDFFKRRPLYYPKTQHLPRINNIPHSAPECSVQKESKAE